MQQAHAGLVPHRLVLLDEHGAPPHPGDAASAVLLGAALSLLLAEALAIHTCVYAFGWDHDVCTSDQENTSYDCEVAAVNEKLWKEKE